MSKKIFDPIHQFIKLDETEVKLIKTVPFKRMQQVHQLGSAMYVYGGGHHKRYEHVLGTCFVVSKIFDQVTTNKFHNLFPKFDHAILPYWRRVLRVAALCHDLGHPPFSHLAELELMGKNGHEEWTLKIVRSDHIAPILEEDGIDVEDVAKVAVGEKLYRGKMTPWECLVSEMLTGDFFGGDRIDYLLRDAYFTGLAYGHFDYLQLIDSLRILPFNEKMALGVEESGLESCYALLLARYFMHKRLYHNQKVKSYSHHLKKFIIHYFQGKPYLDSVDDFLRINDFDILKEINVALFDESHPMHRDAKAIMDQSDRISVFSMSMDEYNTLLEDLELKDSVIHFEKSPVSRPKHPLGFPVLLKNDIVRAARDVSDVNLPAHFKNWAYIPPERVDAVVKKINYDPNRT